MFNPMKLASIFPAMALVLGLIGCEGNSSTMTQGGSPVIIPIEIDKTIEALDWDQNNEALMASHAYRSITQNSMLRAVFTKELAGFDLTANLIGLSDVRNCRVSGRMIAAKTDTQCFLANGDEVDCSNSDVVITKNTQLSQALACQDGSDAGKYLDGFFNITQTIDLTDETQKRTSTTISAVGEVAKLDENGDPVLDDKGDPAVEKLTDYLFQSEYITFFFDNEYESYVNFSADNLVCGEKSYETVDEQGMRSDEVGAQEGDGATPYYLYTRFTGLDLRSIPDESCGEEDEVVITYSNEFTATMESAAMGGGEGRKTKATWPDMVLTLAGEPMGTLTLDHENAAGTYTVVLDFNTEGQVTITPPNAANQTTLTLTEFLSLSKPVAAK